MSRMDENNNSFQLYSEALNEEIFTNALRDPCNEMNQNIPLKEIVTDKNVVNGHCQSNGVLCTSL